MQFARHSPAPVESQVCLLDRLTPQSGILDPPNKDWLC